MRNSDILVGPGGLSSVRTVPSVLTISSAQLPGRQGCFSIVAVRLESSSVF